MDVAGHRPSGESVLVGDLVREVIADVAPDELALVDRLRQLDNGDAVRLLQRRRRGGDLLGFGLDEVVVLASPIVWVAVDEAVKRFTDTAITGGGKAVRQRLRRLLGRGEGAPIVPEFTREQIADVHTQVADAAMRAGMDADRARIIADKVGIRLALRGSGVDAARPPEP
ncbi:hypothetical protein DFR70_109314 [Nocardia tenerifensis]|uniref:Uncharacterized protein n=1 Tax=Nocardia tenerifensis TaxID=228006 RepID=A0A318K0G2_9NOCA|nr:hypothetical protein [Nocardia tenerifensis]PXX61122.1 hypothetical protein DFR70_109314 [Nocardia tenerifensis]